MNEPFYDFIVLDEAHRFEFMSIGTRCIQKAIIFYKTDYPDVVTLTLANVLENGTLDVFTISDNGDRNRILATVMQSITLFLNTHPAKTIAFTGSSPSRTRLYKIVISRELNILTRQYRIQGIGPLGIEEFVSAHEYRHFLISLKKDSIV